LSSGWGYIAAFLFLRVAVGYGDPNPFVPQGTALYTVLSVLNVTKHPLSLQFVCMTLGPALLLLGLGRSKPIETLGRVPLFFYVVHAYVLHVIAILWALAAGFPSSSFDFATRYGGRPAGFRIPAVGDHPVCADDNPDCVSVVGLL